MKKKLFEYIKFLSAAIIITLVIRVVFVQSYRLPTYSMLPTLLDGDYMLANKFIFGVKLPFSEKRHFVLRMPQRGEIIIFQSPTKPRRALVKRVIGVEGDIIKGENKQIFVNGDLIEEPYVQHIDNSFQDGRDSFGHYRVPEGKIFVLGDNRDDSIDSRTWGYADIKDVEGKPFILYWSWDNEKKTPRFERVGRLIN